MRSTFVDKTENMNGQCRPRASKALKIAPIVLMVINMHSEAEDILKTDNF